MSINLPSVYLNKLKELFAAKDHGTHVSTSTCVTSINNQKGNVTLGPASGIIGYPNYAEAIYIGFKGAVAYNTYKGYSDAAKKSGWYGTTEKNNPVLIWYFKSQSDLDKFESSVQKNSYFYRRYVYGNAAGLIPEEKVIDTSAGQVTVYTVQNTYQTYCGFYKVNANGFLNISTAGNWDAMIFLNHVAIFDRYTTGQQGTIDAMLPVQTNDEICIAFREDEYSSNKFAAGQEVSGYPIIHSYFIPFL